MFFLSHAQLTFYLVTGIPISRHVGGVACGLVTSSDAEDPKKPDIELYRLMTDILVRRIIKLSPEQCSVQDSSFRYIFFVCSLLICVICTRSHHHETISLPTKSPPRNMDLNSYLKDKHKKKQFLHFKLTI